MVLRSSPAPAGPRDVPPFAPVSSPFLAQRVWRFFQEAVCIGFKRFSEEDRIFAP